MDKRVWTAVVAFGLALTMAAGGSAQTGGSELDRLAWLAGCWTGAGAGRQVDEQWMKPLGGTMMGMSRTVAGGRTVASETLVIRQTGSEIAYVARPSNQAEASFRMVSGGADAVTFETPHTTSRSGSSIA